MFSDRRTCDECGHSPMSHTCWFNHEILKPIQRFGSEGEGGEFAARRGDAEFADSNEGGVAGARDPSRLG